MSGIGPFYSENIPLGPSKGYCVKCRSVIVADEHICNAEVERGKRVSN